MIRLRKWTQPIELTDTLKYLWVMFDRKLNFAAHVKLVRAKISEIVNKLINVMRRTYGRKGEYIKSSPVRKRDLGS